MNSTQPVSQVPRELVKNILWYHAVLWAMTSVTSLALPQVLLWVETIVQGRGTTCLLGFLTTPVCWYAVLPFMWMLRLLWVILPPASSVVYSLQVARTSLSLLILHGAVIVAALLESMLHRVA